jgi:spore germination protein PB
MNWYINQTITIGQLRVDAVTNSSVLQIGSSGSIQALSQAYNTGGFTGPAPELTPLEEVAAEVALAPLPRPL